MRILLAGLFVQLVTVLVVSPASAETTGCEIPGGIAYSRPSEETTEVGLRVVLVGVNGISEPSQTFYGDFFWTVTWQDPRLSADALGHSLEGCLLDPGQIWKPRIQILNLRTTEFPMSEIQVDSRGVVVRRVRMVGEFGMSMDLRDYPFDQQTLGLTAITLYGPDEVVLQIGDDDLVALSDVAVPGWRSVPDSAAVTVAALNVPGRTRVVNSVTVAVSVTREVGFYFWKLIVPVSLIVFMAWGVFWIDPGNLEPQVALSASAALTFVAFQLGLNDLLPPIDYLTRADHFVISSQVLVFLALAEAIAAAHFFAIGRKELARSLDRWSRIAYPVLFVIVVCLSFLI